MDLITVTKKKKRLLHTKGHTTFLQITKSMLFHGISSEKRDSFYWMQTPYAVKWHTTDIFDHYHHITTWTTNKI